MENKLINSGFSLTTQWSLSNFP